MTWIRQESYLQQSTVAQWSNQLTAATPGGKRRLGHCLPAERGQGTGGSELSSSEEQPCSSAVPLPRGVLPHSHSFNFSLAFGTKFDYFTVRHRRPCHYAWCSCCIGGNTLAPFEIICAWLYITQDAINHTESSLLGWCSNAQVHLLLLISVVPFQLYTEWNKR